MILYQFDKVLRVARAGNGPYGAPREWFCIDAGGGSARDDQRCLGLPVVVGHKFNFTRKSLCNGCGCLNAVIFGFAPAAIFQAYFRYLILGHLMFQFYDAALYPVLAKHGSGVYYHIFRDDTHGNATFLKPIRQPLFIRNIISVFFPEVIDLSQGPPPLASTATGRRGLPGSRPVCLTAMIYASSCFYFWFSNSPRRFLTSDKASSKYFACPWSASISCSRVGAAKVICEAAPKGIPQRPKKPRPPRPPRAPLKPAPIPRPKPKPIPLPRPPAVLAKPGVAYPAQ